MDNLNRRTFLKAVGAVGGAAVSRAATAPPRPNIVLIMGDDMGYSDLGCYGSEINTPNLNALAANGLRFTQFYNTARCCPTRASLLTGLYPHQAGVGGMMRDSGVDGYRGSLNRHCMTIAEVLRTAGYRTYMCGKWHVTPIERREHWPRQRGFDRYYGTIHGAGSFYDPNSLVRDDKLISPYADPDYRPQQFYYTDAISDNAVAFLAEHARKHTDKPFFLYVAYTAAHWPMHAPAEEIAKYRGRYDAGYGPIRRARYERMKKLGVIRGQWELSPQAGDWQKTANRAWEARCMEVYAAMIDRMDQGIGRLVGELRHLGQLHNTLIFFLQDNGGCAEGQGRKPRGTYRSRPDKAPFSPMALTALQPDMIPKQTRDGFPVVMGPGIMPGPADTFIAYGKAWANVSNTPFREYKHWVHEGGISTPLIVHWPDMVADRGAIREQPGHLIDIMATCVEVSGARYPTEYRGQPITPLEGVSLMPAFAGRPLMREAVYWEHERNVAIRVGKWKLVAKKGLGPEGVALGKWELYDMEADRSELHDLAGQQPDRVRKMGEMFNRYARRANVLPLPHPRGKKR